MFNKLTQQLTGIFDGVKRKGAVTEKDIEKCLREIRIALLEADVALPVAKQFIKDIKEKALGEDVIKSITPDQVIKKIIHAHLVELLGGDAENTLKQKGVILMAGLQGSGKTTSSAKLANRLKKQEARVLLASLDVYRPAAQHQLEVLGKQIGVDTLPIIEAEKPLAITKRASCPTTN